MARPGLVARAGDRRLLTGAASLVRILFCYLLPGLLSRERTELTSEIPVQEKFAEFIFQALGRISSKVVCSGYRRGFLRLRRATGQVQGGQDTRKPYHQAHHLRHCNNRLGIRREQRNRSVYSDSSGISFARSDVTRLAVSTGCGAGGQVRNCHHGTRYISHHHDGG